ncbi:MAG TPA: alpha/beta fold hydrolase [Candidatus Obscuribacter sp.]|nr:alpha/beta fold hydrolase [Candidatus Obscuribacter sp.]HNG74025.1 alpha/beta fold hydrolase [Candidatus Obscuribacter sp.]
MSLSSSSFVKKCFKKFGIAPGNFGTASNAGAGRILAGSLVLAAALCALMLPAQARPERDDNPREHAMGFLPDVPMSVWQDPELEQRGIVVAVHGLVMHGRVYDTMARELAKDGLTVVAPDLRGYGRWQKLSEEESNRKSGNRSEKKSEKKSEKIEYVSSLNDLKEVVSALRANSPDLPIFMVGESMGAGLSLRVAEALPGQVNGLVLSSPAIKRRFYMEPEMVKDLAGLVRNPLREVDLVPYIRKFASENPTVSEEAIHDPYVRKHLSCLDLLNTATFIRGNISHARGVPATVPVLVIQGDKDRMLRHEAVSALLSRLKSRDTTMCWLPGKGHVLIETSHIEPNTMDTIRGWLSQHLPARSSSLISSMPAGTNLFSASELSK